MVVERLGPHVRIHPVGPVDAEPQLPGSKSLTQRMLICAALANGRSVLRGPLLADDSRLLSEGLRQLGVQVEWHEAQREIAVDGRGGALLSTGADLYAGAAGTAMRFLTALVCLGHGRFRVDGSPRMRQRPIAQLVDALQDLGAQIGYDGVSGYPPLMVLGRGLTGGHVQFDKPPSSQFVSAILMIAPYALRDVLVSIRGPLASRPYVSMTLVVMRTMGVEALESNARRFIVPGAQQYRPGEYAVEPDASAASYFFAAAALTGGRTRINGLTRASPQGDVGFVNVLERMGCRVVAGADYIEVFGPPPDSLHGVTEDLNAMPDVAQTLAAVALFARGPTEIRNVASLRVKETDRLQALASELTRLGARVESREDGLTIIPPTRVTPAEIDTYDDHRMAMAFAIAGLAMDGLLIKNAACVSKSFPDFFDALARLDHPAPG